MVPLGSDCQQQKAKLYKFCSEVIEQFFGSGRSTPPAISIAVKHPTSIVYYESTRFSFATGKVVMHTQTTTTKQNMAGWI